MENMLVTQNINFVLVFFEGILSFLSPCVLPLIPVYISYLAGNGKKENEDGTIYYERKTVFINTIMFVLGISFTFFLLGISFSALGTFFKEYRQTFSTIAGIIILLMGLIQLGIIRIPFLEKEHKILFFKKDKKVTPIIAFVMGFTFSFAWTPCIGPALASVLALASSSSNLVVGNILVLLYSIGFSIPFLLVGLFTTQILNFFKEKRKIVQYTIKISGIILIIMGLLTITGMTEKIAGSLFNLNNNSQVQEQNNNEIENENNNEIKAENNQSEQVQEETNNTSEQQENNDNLTTAFDFTLVDQYGKTHTLSEYKGKVVFLNFWTTWCPPCKEELPYIQEIYEEYNENKDDVIILGIANPKTSNSAYSQDNKTIEEIKEFLIQNNLTYPVVFDETGEIFDKYFIQAFPTTFMINKDGKIYGYVTGGLTKDNMKSIINQTLTNEKN